ncbi:MAG TPA: PDZ domain-containing protein [Flavilitoribacter sp.]|nr:PDZ domain-containing protein [Flavilitoribacter sp.]
MKKFTLMLLGLAFFAVPLSIQAQEKMEGQPAAVIVKKVTTTDGGITIVKETVPEGQSVIHELKDLKDLKGENVEIHILNDEGLEINLDQKAETILYIRKAKEDMDRMKGDMENMQNEFKQLRIYMHDNQELGEKMKELGEKMGSFNAVSVSDQRPLLGIYPDENREGKGLAIGSLAGEEGAKAAGMLSGDVITAVDGQAINSTSDLRNVLSAHKVGDLVKVNYDRNGQAAETTVKLKGSSYNYSYSYSYERDPCKVFIGVYVGSTGDNGEGVRVNGIIRGTSAEKYGIQAKDVILALDDVPTNSFSELHRERDKHQPGEWYTLSILRNGQRMEIDAQFKSCEKTAEEVTEPVEEPVAEELVETVEEVAQPVVQPDFELQPESWKIYPNPTFGRLQLEFQAEPLPTTIQIQDVSGKTVYREARNQFDGYYNETIDLSSALPGQYLLSVQQGDKIKTEKIVLMPRA